jgi:putative polyhydroxyalkanoate system protein
MAAVHVRQAHTMNKTDAKLKLLSFEQLLKNYRVSLTWNGFHAAISGVGVSGDVKVEDAAVEVNVSLGFLAKAAGVDPEKLRLSIAKRLKEAYEV